MPLFMGLCGYFFYRSLKKWSSVKEYVQKKLPDRLLGLMLPMLVFGLLKNFILIAQGSYDLKAITFFKKWILMSHQVWFLGDLALNTLIVLFLWHFCKGKLRYDWAIFLIGVPFTVIPVITYTTPWMYFYFVVGFCIAAYFTVTDKSIRWWKIVLPGFIVCYLAFSYQHGEPLDFSLSIHKFGMERLLLNDSLKLALGLLGSYLVLAAVYVVAKRLQGTRLFSHIATGGQYTLESYLLQIIIVEMLFGPIYRAFRDSSGIDFFNYAGMFGLSMRGLITFCAAIIFFEFVLHLGIWMCRKKYLARIFFYRKVS